jgi:hypothetical protein
MQVHGMDPTLTARSSRGGQSLKGQVVNGNNNLPSILKVRMHTPIDRNDNSISNGGKDDSSLETIGIYERDSNSNDTAATAPRHVTWEPEVIDRRGCSDCRWDYAPNLRGLIEKISEMKLLSKLDSGAQGLGRRLERLGMKCIGRLAPCASTACAREAHGKVVSLIIDTEEYNDLVDLDDFVHVTRMHDEMDQNNCPYRDVIKESRDAIGNVFTFNEIGRTKCGWYEDEMPLSHTRLKNLMDDISSSSCASRCNIETGRGETISVMLPWEDSSSVKMHNYQHSPDQNFSYVSPMSTAAVHTKHQARHVASATPTFPTTSTQPCERLSRGQRHSSRNAIKSTTKTPSKIDNGKRNSNTKLRRRIICGMKKPIRFISIGINRNLKKSPYPKRILAITAAYPSRHGK